MSTAAHQPMMKCGHTANARMDGKPCCVICVGTHPGATETNEPPDLTGRTAQCSCGSTSPSSADLPFFEFRGEGSRSATDTCRHCRYAESAHDPVFMAKQVMKTTVVERGKCPGFEPIGAWEHDGYYCGHGGWD